MTQNISGQITCSACHQRFDVDALVYNELRERFCCAHCGSDQFRPDLESGGPVPPELTPCRTTPLPTSQELIKVLGLVTKELRREHMERPDRYCTTHCSQCCAINQAETLLAAAQ